MKESIKKGKVTMIITVGIACFVLVLVMTMQFKIVNETDITSIESMRETELRTELANWKEKYEETNEQYEETMLKIEEYQQTKESNEETGKLIEEELAQSNLIAGSTDVQGEGIEIVLRESDSEEIGQITSDNLLIIVNALKLAGAEAISINEERIINMTDIVTINESFIRVNGQRILSPYVIKAIGNQTYLESGLLGNGGCVDELRKIGHDISINKKNNVKINAYSKEIRTKYIQ